jgi:hypothetical protein
MRLLAEDVLQSLRDGIRGIEGLHLVAEREPGLSTGFPEFDRLLADGGLRRGTLIEWRGDGNCSGAQTLTLAVTTHLLRTEGIVVVIDEAGDFYPVSAAQLGVPLERTVLVRSGDPRSALWAWEEALRFPGITVTLGRIGAVADKVVRRLQLAVETGGGLGFLIRPPGTVGASAATRVCVEPLPGHACGQRVRVQVTRGQSGTAAFAELELGHEASLVSVVPQLARPVANGRRAVG